MSPANPVHLERLERINTIGRPQSASKRSPLILLREITFTSSQKKALLFVAVLAVALSTVIFLAAQAKPRAEVIPETITSTPSTTSDRSISSNDFLVVDVQGEVVNPGVYQVPLGSRVGDAITAAGGVKKGRSTASVNLARFLEDGEQIYLSEGESSFTTSASSHGGAQGKLNINRASVNELDGLPGVGPVLAARIAAYRQSNGNFASVDDLRKVSGIGPAKFNDLRDFITV